MWFLRIERATQPARQPEAGGAIVFAYDAGARVGVRLLFQPEAKLEQPVALHPALGVE